MRKRSHMSARKNHCGLGKVTENFDTRLLLTFLVVAAAPNALSVYRSDFATSF